MVQKTTQLRDVMEQSIFLPMALVVLQQDRAIIENSPFKIKKVYLDLVDQSFQEIHNELYKVKRYMAKNKLQVHLIQRDKSFTNYLFLYDGFEEYRNYFNPTIRNKVQQLLDQYFKGYSTTMTQLK